MEVIIVLCALFQRLLESNCEIRLLLFCSLISFFSSIELS